MENFATFHFGRCIVFIAILQGWKSSLEILQKTLSWCFHSLTRWSITSFPKPNNYFTIFSHVFDFLDKMAESLLVTYKIVEAVMAYSFFFLALDGGPINFVFQCCLFEDSH
ncbi:hypothetical protein P9112_007580 [Eukaryota sp. TZLM1-RC]